MNWVSKNIVWRIYEIQDNFNRRPAMRHLFFGTANEIWMHVTNRFWHLQGVEDNETVVNGTKSWCVMVNELLNPRRASRSMQQAASCGRQQILLITMKRRHLTSGWKNPDYWFNFKGSMPCKLMRCRMSFTSANGSLNNNISNKGQSRVGGTYMPTLDCFCGIVRWEKMCLDVPRPLVRRLSLNSLKCP